MDVAQLARFTTALEADAGISGSGFGVMNYWSRAATAAEALAGVSNAANDNMAGYRKRVALALEHLAGTDGAEENTNLAGYMERIADAGEALAAVTYPGNSANRAVLAAESRAIGFGNASLALAFTQERYRQQRTRTNKCTNYNANPSDTTNVTKGGDAAATLTVVDDAAALEAAGLSAYGPNVYKLDNSAGASTAFANISGAVGNLNQQTVSAYTRGTGSARVEITGVNGGQYTLPQVYARRSVALTPAATTNVAVIAAVAGSVVYFILNQLEEAPRASAPIVVEGASASVTESAYVTGPVRRNLLIYSNDYTNAAWTKTDTTVTTPGAISGPNGPLSLLTEGSAGTANVSQTYTAIAGSLKTHSVDLKRGNHDWVRVTLYDGGSNVVLQWVNLATGTLGSLSLIGTASDGSATIEDLGDGIYRVAVSGRLPGASYLAWTASANADGSTTRVNGASRYQGCSQLEFGDTATAYIDTQGTARAVGGVMDLYGATFDNGTNPSGEVTDTGVEMFPADVPRITEDGYWSRGAVTNLAFWSQEFGNAYWGKVGIAVAADAIAAPDGSLTADTLTRTSTGSNGNVAGVIAGTVDNTYTASAFVKAKSAGNRYGLRIQGTFPDRGDAVFDLDTGTLVGVNNGGAYTGAAGTITPVGNGWYRVTLTTTSVGTAPSTVVHGPTDSTRTVGAWEAPSSILSDCYVWQIQVVAGTQAGPIIVTTGSAASVGADVKVLSSVPLADEDWIIFTTLDFRVRDIDARPLTISDGTLNNRIGFARLAANSFIGYINAGGVSQTISAGAAPTVTTGRAVGLIRRQGGSYSFGYKLPDGTKSMAASGAAGAFPAGLNRLDVGNLMGSSAPANSPIEFVDIRRGTFTDAECLAILEAA